MRNKTQGASVFLRMALRAESRQYRGMGKDPRSEAIRNYLQHVLAVKGWSGAELARRIGMSASTINKRIKPEWEGGAHIDTLRRIAEKSGIPLPDSITGGVPEPMSLARAPRTSQAGHAGVTAVGSLFGGPELPVLYTARGAKYMKVRPIVAERVARPASLASVADAYGMLIHGDDAADRYRAGEFILVNPILPLRPGTDVVMISGPLDQDRDVGVWLLIEELADDWRVQSFSTKAESVLSKTAWPIVHRIVGRLDR
jgi:hypothetical protein